MKFSKSGVLLLAMSTLVSSFSFLIDKKVWLGCLALVKNALLRLTLEEVIKYLNMAQWTMYSFFFFFLDFLPFQSSFSSFSSFNDSLCLIALLEGGKNYLYVQLDCIHDS